MSTTYHDIEPWSLKNAPQNTLKDQALLHVLHRDNQLLLDEFCCFIPLRLRSSYRHSLPYKIQNRPHPAGSNTVRPHR